MNQFVLVVRTQDLARVAKHLSRLEKSVIAVELSFADETLTLRLGKTSDDLNADGEWPGSVSVPRKWLTSVSMHPSKNEPVTDLRVYDGKLWARNFGVVCTVEQTLDAVNDAS
jgi:hypothetical protein